MITCLGHDRPPVAVAGTVAREFARRKQLVFDEDLARIRILPYLDEHRHSEDY